MKKYVLITFVTLGMSGCQSIYIPQAREVKKKPRSNGVIALPTSPRAEDRQKADELMKQNCGNLVVNVAEEGEVVVGQEIKSNTNSTNRDDSRRSAGKLFGIPIVSGTASGTETQNNSVTSQVKEWQVVYNCENDKPVIKAK
jgi:hypothetical protein